ncbi:aldehyde dehydrogenase family protein [Streptomyces sp. NPDC008092]|uniref:aldehyde dehydrogenase n=1 Tax=Streptomyces sp. NPDC008092 TaxID=3364808 RepID=UPI0036E7EA9F
MKYVHTKLFIGGFWVTPVSTEVNTVVGAATEEPIGQTPVAGPEDIDVAVAAARRGFVSWSQTAAADRADILDRFAAALISRADVIGPLVSSENGMPISLSVPANVYAPAATLSYYAGLVRKLEFEEDRPSLAKGVTKVRREPVGVVGAIVPWNYPLMLAMMKIAPALAAGCTVVLKPALETALDANELAAAAEEAGLPPGVLNIVPGSVAASQALVAHPGVDKIAFTGSTPVGRSIGEICGRLLKPVTLELGGKSAAIVLDDADLATTAAGLASASLANNGQTCYASTRILAPAHRYAETLEAVTSMVASLKVGDPLDPATRIGPVVTARQRESIERYIRSGRASGARLTTGGGRPADLNRGWYVEPTVFGDVLNSMPIAQEEIFGPVLSVIAYKDVEEAIALANDSEYGLAGSVWSADVDRANSVARWLQTGSVGINGYSLDIASPFGGYKASGLGRELGPEGLSAYLHLKSVYQPRQASQ